MKIPKKFRYLSLIYLVILTVTIASYVFNIGNSWQEKITDRLFTKHIPQQNIIILAVDDQSLKEVGQWPWPRQVFANVLNHIIDATSVGVDINFSEQSRLGNQDDALLANALQNRSRSTSVILPIQLEERGRVTGQPLSLFAPYAKLGFVNVNEDRDGVVRSEMSVFGDHKSFSFALLNNAKSNTPQDFRINYAGPQGTFLTIPVIDVINDKVPARIFQNATVLVGVTSKDLHDTLNTPFGVMPGVEIHANALETLVTGKFIQPLSPAISLLIFLLLDFLALWLVVYIKRFFIMILSLLGLVVGINLIGFGLFSSGIILPSLYITGSLILITVTSIIFQYISESEEKRFIRKAFQHYLSAELVDELTRDPKKLALGGERRKISILFSDIRGFTTISEAMTPEELTQFMSEYFSAVSDIVLEERGILDKYIGDAIMAFWGAPIFNPDNAKDACRVAKRMLESVAKQNEIWQSRDLPKIQIGIGINTGDVVVGNMGSKKRFNYGIVGDEVNFTSRLEGLTKEYGVNCIVSERTHNEIKDSGFETRALDMVRVKGKKEPKNIFELITKPLTEDFKKQLAFFETGRSHYSKGDWDLAIVAFSSALQIGEDGPSKLLLERTKHLKEHSPENWNGVYEFKTK